MSIPANFSASQLTELPNQSPSGRTDYIMAILGSHPIERTAHVYIPSLRGSRIMAPIRRLASFSTSRCVFDVLSNPARIERESWDAYVMVGTVTVTMVRRCL